MKNRQMQPVKKTTLSRGISAQKLAERAHLSLREIQVRAKEGNFKKLARGEYDELACAWALVEYWHAEAEKRGSSSTAQIQRKNAAIADREEMKARREAEDVDWIVNLVEGMRAEIVKLVAGFRFDLDTEGKLLAGIRDIEKSVRDDLAKHQA